MIKRIIFAGLLCAGCTGTLDKPRLGVGDFADAGTTAYALSQSGFVEANPALAWAGPAAPVASLGLKYGVKSLVVAAGADARETNRVVEGLGMGAACWNVALVSGATVGFGTVVPFGICAYGYLRATRDAP